MKLLTPTLLLLLTIQVYSYGPVAPNAANKAAYQADKFIKREAYLKKAGRLPEPHNN